MQLPFKETFEEFLGIIRDLWSTGNRWGRAPILFFGLFPFVLVLYAQGGAWSVAVVLTLVIAAIAAMQMMRVNGWVRLGVGFAALAWLVSGISLTFDLAFIVAGVACVPLSISVIGKPGNWFRQMTAWAIAVAILGITIVWAVRESVPLWMPPMVVMACVPAVAFVALWVWHPLLLGLATGTTEKGRKALWIFFAATAAECALGLYYAFLIYAGASRTVIPWAFALVLVATLFGLGTKGVWRTWLMSVTIASFLVLTAISLLWDKPAGEKTIGERIGGWYVRLWTESPSKTGSAVYVPAVCQPLPVRTASESPTLIHLEPNVWSGWQPLGWNTDWIIDWSTPDEFLEMEYNDGSSSRRKHGVSNNINHESGRPHLGPGNSELKVRVRSQTGGCAWITKSWRGLLPRSL